MNLKKIQECERNQFDKLKKYQLSNKFKRIGWLIVILSFILLLSKRFLFTEQEILGQIAKNVALLGLLIVIISKEKIEDELIGVIRGKAFSFAFVAGVVYTLVMPVTDFLVDLAIGNKEASYSELGDFIILWFMMVVYLAFFHLLKRTR
jgi:hypothetical protein